MDKFELRDKIVLVAGASSGIGATTVELLLGEGARVVAAARRMDRLQSLAKDRPGHCLPLQLDVADPAEEAELPAVAENTDASSVESEPANEAVQAAATAQTSVDEQSQSGS